jgi:hypothetical protein
MFRTVTVGTTHAFTRPYTVSDNSCAGALFHDARADKEQR